MRLLLTLLLVAVPACSAGATREPAEPRSASASASASPSASASASPSGSASPSPSPSPAPLAQLPRGGRAIFPAHVVVMAYGTATTDALGVLGEGTPDQAAKRLTADAAPFGPASGRRVLPAFELITTVAQRSAGPDGDFSGEVAEADVQRYLDAARRAKMLLVLDFQPGRADLLAQVKRYERFLREPDVGIALDPEWVLRPGQKPGRQIGTLDAATIDRVATYLSELTTAAKLPEKLFLVHQFQKRMLPDREAIVERPGLALVFHIDGFGPRRDKRKTYDLLAVRSGPAHNGFKLFLDEDPDLLTPAETMALVPRPELVSYQ